MIKEVNTPNERELMAKLIRETADIIADGLLFGLYNFVEIKEMPYSTTIEARNKRQMVAKTKEFKGKC